MSVPTQNVKLVMNFALKAPAGVEDQAQFGLWGQYNTPPADLNAFLLAYAEYARDQWVSGVDKSSYSSAAELTFVQAITYDTGGHTSAEQRAPTTPGDWVGAQIRSMPWETSLCITLYTYPPGSFVPNARRRRGRLYLPPIGAGVLANNSSGELADADALAFAQDVRDWIAAIEGHVFSGSVAVTPRVFSRADSAMHDIFAVGVDGKIDSQRRRQKSELATRQFINV